MLLGNGKESKQKGPTSPKKNTQLPCRQFSLPLVQERSTLPTGAAPSQRGKRCRSFPHSPDPLARLSCRQPCFLPFFACLAFWCVSLPFFSIPSAPCSLSPLSIATMLRSFVCLAHVDPVVVRSGCIAHRVGVSHRELPRRPYVVVTTHRAVLPRELAPDATDLAVPWPSFLKNPSPYFDLLWVALSLFFLPKTTVPRSCTDISATSSFANVYPYRVSQVPTMEKADATQYEDQAGAAAAAEAGFAPNLPANDRLVDIDPAVEKRLLRKMDRVLVVLVFVCCTSSVASVPPLGASR